MARKRRGRGEGSIFQKADGRWVGRISLGYGSDGKRRQREVTGATKRIVQQKLAELQQKSAAGTLQEPSRLTVGQYLDGWLESNREGWAASTHDRYSRTVRNHIAPHIGGTRLTSIRPDVVRQFYATLAANGATPSTRGKVHTILHRAFKLAAREGLLPNNPAALVEPPKYKPAERQVLTAEQARALLRAAEGDRLEAFFVLLILTGARRGELLALHWSDVDFENHRITIRHTLEELNGQHRLKPPKTKAGRRIVGISEAAVSALRDHQARMMREGLAGCDIVFCDLAGGFLRASNVHRRHWQPIRKAAGLPDGLWQNLHIHDMRHTHASGLFAEGLDVLQISERLGHADVNVTLSTYTHLLPGRESAAPAAFDDFLKRKA